MKLIETSRRELMDKLNLVNYIRKNFPNAQMEGDRFIDDGITIQNAHGFDWTIPDQKPGAMVIASIRPYKQLKRRPKEETPTRVYGVQDYNLTGRHIQLLLNNIDHTKAYDVLKKALNCQEKALSKA